MTPGELTHIDLWGKYSIHSIQGNYYYVVLVDNNSHWITINYLKEKNQATRYIKNYQMQKLQRLACLAIVGGMKSMPTDLLNAHTGLHPIELTLLRICHRATIRLCTLPTSHPLHAVTQSAFRSPPQKHHEPISYALQIFELNPHKFEMIAPNTTPPTYTPKFR